jgi:hypothetical protein
MYGYFSQDNSTACLATAIYPQYLVLYEHGNEHLDPIKSGGFLDYLSNCSINLWRRLHYGI